MTNGLVGGARQREGAQMHECEGDLAGRIGVLEQPGVTVIRVSGHVTDAMREQAGEALTTAVNREVPVVLDLGQVRSIDAPSIAFLIQCCTIGAEEGLRVILRHPPREVTDVLGLLGLGHAFLDRSTEYRSWPPEILHA